MKLERRIIYESKPVDPKDGKFPGELEKTEQDEQDIEVALGILWKYLEKLEVDPDGKISLDQVHLFYNRQFNKLSRDHRGCLGMQHPETSRIQVVKPSNRLRMMMALVHETVHHEAVRKWEFNPNTTGNDQLYRTGYSLRDRRNPEGEMYQLDGFNEGVVEMIAYDAIMEARAELIPYLQMPKKNFQDKVWGEITYHDQTHLVRLVTDAVAEKQKVSSRDVFLTIARGEFTGEMMWMRSIDDAFGSNSLRTLSFFVASPKDEVERKRNTKILEYFSEQNPQKRAEIQAEIY